MRSDARRTAGVSISCRALRKAWPRLLSRFSFSFHGIGTRMFTVGFSPARVYSIVTVAHMIGPSPVSTGAASKAVSRSITFAVEGLSIILTERANGAAVPTDRCSCPNLAFAGGFYRPIQFDPDRGMIAGFLPQPRTSRSTSAAFRCPARFGDSSRWSMRRPALRT